MRNCSSTELMGLHYSASITHYSLNSSMHVQYIKMNGGRRPNQGRGTVNQRTGAREAPSCTGTQDLCITYLILCELYCTRVNFNHRWAQISVWRCRRRPRAGRRALTRSRRPRPLSMRTRPNPNTTSSKSSFSTCEMKAFPPR